MCRTWAALHVGVLKKFKGFTRGLKFYLGTPEHVRMFSSLVKFGNTLISSSGNLPVDHIVNETKAKVMVCLKILIGYFFKKKPKALYSVANPLFQAVVELAPSIVEMLVQLGALRGDQTVETMCANGYINTMVKVGIDMLCILC